MAEPEFPDVYSDAVSIATGPYGLAVSFMLTDPLQGAPDPKLPGRIVARVRVAPELARAMVSILQRSLEKLPDPKLSYSDDTIEDGQ